MIKSFIAAAIATAVFLTTPINWGLSHTEKGMPPTPPKEAVELLGKYDGLYRQDTDQKHVFLTFDLGYEAGYTKEVLDTLAHHSIKAIFFLCGHYLKETEIINRMISEGHQIGNHTDKHKDLPTLSHKNVETDIMTFQNDFIKLYPNAQAPVYFRPPKGRFDEKTVNIAKDNGLKTMMWSIAIHDWGKQPIDANKSAGKIASRIHPGAIILLHITNAGTPRMLEKLIPLLQQDGYEFASPDNLEQN